MNCVSCPFFQKKKERERGALEVIGVSMEFSAWARPKVLEE